MTVSLHYDGAYGMGEKYNAVNQKGHTAVNEVEEKFCFQGEKTYCPAPFFWTNTGFGLYAATDERTSFRFGEKAVCAELPVDCRVVLFSGCPERSFGITWICSARQSCAQMGLWAVDLRQPLGQPGESGAGGGAGGGTRAFPVCALVAEAWSDEATFYVFRGAKVCS